ncbi:MAG: kdgK [Verrucomicrobiales bacterium]|nr:kdgK [Verrucomicrobiales bacterium]
MSKVVTFGEIMMRLATPQRLRFLQANNLEMTFGGGEANVAVSLAQFGIEAAFVTRLPNNDLAQTCVNQLRGYGVETKHILRGGERIGIYFLETGASQRGSNVIYDRANSAISTIDPASLNWNEILKGATWFHFTGITPALSDAAARAAGEAAKAAKALGLTVSCDLNFRKKLWSPAKAQEVMSGLMANVDYCIANEEDAEKVFGIKAAGAEVSEGKLDHHRYIEVAEKLVDRFKFKGVAITLRESFSASHNGWSGMFYTSADKKAAFSRRYDLEIVDRVGGGDSFAAGLIYGLLQKQSPQDALEFAVAASCLKHSISGDFNLCSLSEVKTLLAGDGSGRVQR